MKKILLFMLCITTFCYAQYPTSGLISAYELNGNLNDVANGQNMTIGNGFMLYPLDRFDNSGSVARLLFGDARRSDIDYPSGTAFGSYQDQFAVSFWIKTTVNDSNRKVIFEDSDRADGTDTSFDGYYIYLEEGKVGINASIRFPGITDYRGKESATIVNDGDWHHVYIWMAHRAIVGNGGTQIQISMAIDGENESTSTYDIFRFHSSIQSSYDTAGDIVLGNNRAGNLPNTYKYVNDIDEILFYNRKLTQSEITSIATAQNFCFVPETSLLSFSNTTNTGTDINISDAETYDIAYVRSGLPIGQATIVNNVVSTTTITGLEPNVTYDVYLRKICANTTSWSDPVNFTTTRDTGRLYVNPNATGLNSGTSWQNAFTDLNTALTQARNSEEIWITGGVYKPTTTNDRHASFSIVRGISLVGGFAGTESTKEERVYGSNETILSGDLNGDDDADISPENPLRSDNSYQVVQTNLSITNISVPITFDRLTITGGNANATSGDNRLGAAIFKSVSARTMTLLDCKIINNSARIGVIYSSFDYFGNLSIERTLIDNNVCNIGTIYGVTSRFSSSVTAGANIVLSNSQITNNKSIDILSNDGGAGSTIFYQAAPHATLNLKVENCTIANNEDAGTISGYNNFNRSTIIAQRTLNGGTPTAVAVDVTNTIFYNNTNAGGNVARAITAGNTTTPDPDVTIANSTDENNFSNIPSGNVTNGSNANPLFVNAASGDFSLSSGSPAIDTGDNALSNAVLDIGNNPRIANSAIDQGAIENCTSCYTLTLNVVGNGTVENNGVALRSVSSFNQNTALSLIPIADATYAFYEWSDDATGNVNPLAITLDSDKTITVTFIEVPIYVDKDATGNNDGSSWANAYTDLTTALAAATTDTHAIWIAAGTYTPDASNRSARFTIAVDDLKIYGGFAGTETLLSDRNMNLIHTTHETILSGDLAGNDDTNITFTNATRDDNSYNIVYVDGHNTLLDGLTISDGHAIISVGSSTSGAGIQLDAVKNNFTLKNSIIKNNVAATGAGFFCYNGGIIEPSYITFDTCVFENNLTHAGGTTFYILSLNQGMADFTLVNSLIKNNRTQDYFTQLGAGAAAGWLRIRNTSNLFSFTVNISNNTFVNNTNGGTGTSDFSTLSFSREAGNYNSLELANNIFWDNTDNNGNTALAIGGRIPNTLPSNVTVFNSIDEDNFSTITNTTNISNSDPLFVNAASENYTLQTGSPAIDAGDNTKLPAGITTDLAGNVRIEDGTVDIGCYEKVTLAITISPKAYLQGAYTSTSTLMRDDLRAGGHLPTMTPYSDGVSCNASVFTTTGNDAIVDWVFVELRDKGDNTSILYSQSALLQRDGDVVAVDGTSDLVFAAPEDDYFVVVRHRNHLSVMSANVYSLTGTSTTVDFTNSATQTYGTNSQASSSTPTGIMGMWSGNANGDTIVQYSGTTPDAPSILSQVLNDAGNFLNFPTFVVTGYYTYDINMDGSTQYTGTTPDTPNILQNVLAHPGNFLNFSTYQIQEQLPEN